MTAINTIARKEPAVGIGASITAILYAVYAILRVSGVEVTDDMARSVETLVLALCAIPAVSGFLTRFFVFSPNSADRIANGHYVAGTPSLGVQPKLPNPGAV